MYVYRRSRTCVVISSERSHSQSAAGFYRQPLRRFREGDVSCQEGLELESRKAVFSTARKYGILTGENCGINFAPLFFGIFILFWDVLELIYNI